MTPPPQPQEEKMSELEEVVIEIDKRIAKMNTLIAVNPSQLRQGIKFGYLDIREYIQIKRQEKGELP